MPPMRDPLTEELDPLAILAALGVAGAASAERVTGGTNTAIWRCEHAGSIYALRLFRPEQRDTTHREQLARRAAEGGLPVPPDRCSTTALPTSVSPAERQRAAR